MSDSATDPLAPAFKDDDLVYVDPDNRVVVGKVEFSKTGNPKSMAIPKAEPTVEDKRPSWRKFFPWGTYKSMKRIYRLEGKQGKVMPDKTLDQVIEKALEQPFWD